MNVEECKVPKALFNSKALFNPYQYEPFRKIMEWDEEKRSYITNNKNILITDEVGVGKTFEVGIILRELLSANPHTTVLILCPVKLCENWEKELKENFYFAPSNYRKTHKMGKMTILPYSYFSANGKKSQNLEEERKAEKELVEGITDNNVPVTPDKISACLKEIPKYDVLILDEAHYIRNRGRLWEYINALINECETPGQNKLKIFMTATPIFNSEDDYSNITELLGESFEKTTTTQAKANCYDEILEINTWGNCKENVLDVDDCSGSKEEYTVGKYIAVSSVEQDVIKKIYEVITSEDEDGNSKKKARYGRWTGILKRLAASSFNTLKKFVDKVADINDIQDIMADINDIQDIMEEDLEEVENTAWGSGLKDLLLNWKPEEDSKLMALKKLLEESFEKENKAIIFTCFLDTCEYLKEQLKDDYHIYVITGKTPVKKVEEIKKLFEGDEGKAILLCSDAAKEGHNLQFCSLLIHYDFPYSPATIGQRNGRIYRKGQENKPKVYYLPMNEGYDRRLFGEIIVEKCNIIMEMALKDKLSVMNILPSDRGNIIEDCLRTYIKEDYNNFLAEKEKNIVEEREIKKAYFEKFMYRHFAEKIESDTDKANKKYVWKFSKAEKLYEEVQNSNGDYDYIEMLVAFYKEYVMTEEENGELRIIYQKAYADKKKEFVQWVFGVENQELEEVAREYVKKCYTGNGKFFFDMTEFSEKSETIGEYKDNFKALDVLIRQALVEKNNG